MKVEKVNKSEVTLSMDMTKAKQLLGGLREHKDDLGETAAEIERQLDAAGVTPEELPDHFRSEYMPPND